MGDHDVGKTSILKYLQRDNPDDITTLGIDFVPCNHTSKDGKEYCVKVWDTAGQERFKTITYSFFKKADGIVLLYDITS